MQDPNLSSKTPGTALMQVQKLPTGMEGFDDILHGGLPIGRSTLISGTSGTGKTVFSLNFLHNGIRDFNEPGIFVTFEESPLDILRNAASFGWNLREMVEQDKLFILDASPDPEGQDVAGSFVSIKPVALPLILLRLFFSNTMLSLSCVGRFFG